MSAPKQFSAYRVTYSDDPRVPVGTLLSDKRWDLQRAWTKIDLQKGTITEFGGPRIARLCATCRLEFKRATLLGHEEPCTADTPPFTPDDPEVDS